MRYLYAPREDLTDLAAGRVILGAPGATNFPLRLGSELFQRALAARPDGAAEPVHLWDPCCGSGYLLTGLGVLHGSRIARISASDVDEEALIVAAKNLELLEPEGLRRREERLRELGRSHGRRSHLEALDSASRLRGRLAAAPERTVFRADATRAEEMRAGLGEARPDVVVTDVPYDEMKQWHDPDEGAEAMLAAIDDLLAPEAIVAIVTPKRARPRGDGYRRLQRLRIGRREAHLFARG